MIVPPDRRRDTQLERAGLIECVETRRRRGCIERKLRLAARSFVISPLVLGRLNADPETVRDRFSSTYLIVAASRIIGDVGTLSERADASDKKLTTLTTETEVSFASPADLTAFAGELTAAVEKLAMKYHRPDRPGSRPHRFVVGGHPVITKTPSEAAGEAGVDIPGLTPGTGSKKPPRRVYVEKTGDRARGTHHAGFMLALMDPDDSFRSGHRTRTPMTMRVRGR